jgi:hypothetical protein
LDTQWIAIKDFVRKLVTIAIAGDAATPCLGLLPGSWGLDWGTLRNNRTNVPLSLKVKDFEKITVPEPYQGTV